MKMGLITKRVQETSLITSDSMNLTVPGLTLILVLPTYLKRKMNPQPIHNLKKIKRKSIKSYPLRKNGTVCHTAKHQPIKKEYPLRRLLQCVMRKEPEQNSETVFLIKI